MSETWWPSTADVAALITARTIGASGEEIGDFTDETRPRADQVDAIIEQSASIASAVTGGLDLPVGVAQDAMRSLIALRSAMSVELSYFPEQVGTDSSPFDKLRDMYRDEFDRVTAAVDRAIADASGDGGDVAAGMARYLFPGVTSTWDY